MPKLTSWERRILGKIYARQFSNLERENHSLEGDSNALETGEPGLQREMNSLQKKGILTLSKTGRGREAKLTPLGRRKIVVVMAGGSFDIIHPGHIETLEQAKALGDVLIVSIARDSTFRKNKRREPNHDENLRRKLVSSLRMVDAAVLGSETDILDTAVRLDPDIIVLGYDQRHNENEIRKGLSKRRLNTKVIRLKSSIPEVKSRSLIEKGKAVGLLQEL